MTLSLKAFSSSKLLLLSLLIFLSYSAGELFCPATAGVRKNVIEETDAGLPTSLSYDFSSLYRDGTQIYELTARIDAKTLYLQVVKRGYKFFQQYKTYQNEIQILNVKNDLVFLRMYAPDGMTFSTRLIRFNTFISNTNTSIPITFDIQLPISSITIGGNTVTLQLNKNRILTYKKDTSTVIMVLESENQAYIFEFDTNGVNGFKLLGRVGSATLPIIVAGNKNHIYDSAKSAFYALNPTTQQYTVVSNLTIMGYSVFYYGNLQVAHLENNYVAYYSSDVTTKKATLLMVPQLTSGSWVEEMPISTNEAFFHQDQLNNIIVSSAAKFVWFNLQLSTGTTLRYSKTYSTSNAFTINEIISLFSASTSIYTNSNWAFVLSPSTIRYFTIFQYGYDAMVQKKQEINISDTIKADLASTTSKLIVLSLKCKCAQTSKPKLVCFNGSLQCIALTAKQFKQCTTTL